MMLSRFFLNPKNRDVQRCIADSHQLHARVISLFVPVKASDGSAPRATQGILHRLELEGGGPDGQHERIRLLVQSTELPDASRWPTGFLDPHVGEDAASSTALSHVLDWLMPGRVLRFRLRANPTRKIDTKTREDGKRRHGKRVPVRGDDGRAAWLASRLLAHGMRLQDGLAQRAEGIAHGQSAADKASERRKSHEAHVFDGILEIVDPQLARNALVSGIGPAKAYGFGLLSLARP